MVYGGPDRSDAGSTTTLGIWCNTHRTITATTHNMSSPLLKFYIF